MKGNKIVLIFHSAIRIQRRIFFKTHARKICLIRHFSRSFVFDSMTFSYAKCRVNLLCLNVSLSLDESHAGQLVELRGEPLLGRRGRVPSRPHLSNSIYDIDFEHNCDWSDINEETDITTVIGRTKKRTSFINCDWSDIG